MQQDMRNETDMGTETEGKISREDRLRMKELTGLLNRASEAYYNKDTRRLADSPCRLHGCGGASQGAP